MASGVELATAWVRLVPSADGIQGELTKSLAPEAEKAGDDAGKKAGGKFSAGFKMAATVGAAAIASGVVALFNTGLEELKFGEQINAQTAFSGLLCFSFEKPRNKAAVNPSTRRPAPRGGNSVSFSSTTAGGTRDSAVFGSALTRGDIA